MRSGVPHALDPPDPGHHRSFRGAEALAPGRMSVRNGRCGAGRPDRQAGGDYRARPPMQPALFVAGVEIAGLGWVRRAKG